MFTFNHPKDGQRPQLALCLQAPWKNYLWWFLIKLMLCWMFGIWLDREAKSVPRDDIGDITKSWFRQDSLWCRMQPCCWKILCEEVNYTWYVCVCECVCAASETQQFRIKVPAPAWQGGASCAVKRSIFRHFSKSMMSIFCSTANAPPRTSSIPVHFHSISWAPPTRPPPQR